VTLLATRANQADPISGCNLKYLTHGIVGLLLGALGATMLAALVKGYTDAARGVVGFDRVAMAALQKIVAPIGAVLGAVAGVGIAVWKQKR
jgi:hypothetical protein